MSEVQKFANTDVQKGAVELMKGTNDLQALVIKSGNKEFAAKMRKEISELKVKYMNESKDQEGLTQKELDWLKIDLEKIKLANKIGNVSENLSEMDKLNKEYLTLTPLTLFATQGFGFKVGLTDILNLSPAKMSREQTFIHHFNSSEGNTAKSLNETEANFRSQSVKDYNSKGFASYCNYLDSKGQLNLNNLKNVLGIGKIIELSSIWSNEGGQAKKLIEKTNPQLVDMITNFNSRNKDILKIYNENKNTDFTDLAPVALTNNPIKLKHNAKLLNDPQLVESVKDPAERQKILDKFFKDVINTKGLDVLTVFSAFCKLHNIKMDIAQMKEIAVDVQNHKEKTAKTGIKDLEKSSKDLGEKITKKKDEIKRLKDQLDELKKITPRSPELQKNIEEIGKKLEVKKQELDKIIKEKKANDLKLDKLKLRLIDAKKSKILLENAKIKDLQSFVDGKLTQEQITNNVKKENPDLEKKLNILEKQEKSLNKSLNNNQDKTDNTKNKLTEKEFIEKDGTFIVKTKEGREITGIKPDEKEKMIANPEYAENFVKFHEFAQLIGIPSLGKLKENITTALGDAKISIGEDFINTDQLKIIADKIAGACNKNIASDKKIKVPSDNLYTLANEFKIFTKAETITGANKDHNNSIVDGNTDIFEAALKNANIIDQTGKFHTFAFKDWVDGKKEQKAA